MRWVVYEGDDAAEPVWTTRLTAPGGPAQIAIKGAAVPMSTVRWPQRFRSSSHSPRRRSPMTGPNPNVAGQTAPEADLTDGVPRRSPRRGIHARSLPQG